MRCLLKKFICIVVVLILSLMTACNIGSDGNGGIVVSPNENTLTKLSTPVNIYVDDNMVLRWNTVDNAESYLVIIEESEYSRTTPACDLKKIITKNGVYNIYIKAISGNSLIKNSELSPVFIYEYNGEIVTDGNTQTGLFGQFDNIYTESAYIGYGYDVINSPYVLSKEVKMNYPIFDQEKLKNKKLIMINERDSEDVYVSGNSMETYQQNFEASISTKIKVSKAFSASIAAKYKSTSKSTASALFYEYRHTTTAYHLILQCDFEEYKELLTSSFKRDLMTLDYGTLFQRYGTHVITSAVMGGRYDLNYTMLSDKIINTSELSASIGLQFKAWSVDGNLDVKTGIKETAERSNCTIESTFVAVGGDNIDMSSEDAMFKNKQKWLSSIESNPALVGIRDVNSLVGIWELLGDSPEEQARKAEMKEVFERNGQEAYETILKNYEINPPLTPTDLTVDVVDENGKDVDESNVIAGSTVYLKLNVQPELAVVTKIITSEQSEYFTLDSSTNSIKIKKDVPHNTKIKITVGVGYGVQKDIELIVKRQYTISFDSGQGSKVEPYTEINHGSSVLEPPVPMWNGYVFIGWNKFIEETNEYAPYTFGVPVVEDFTLYATWEPFYPSVKFIHNVSGSGLNEQKVAYKDNLSKYNLDPKIEGYHIVGWYADEHMTTEYDFNAEIVDNIKVYVKWELNEYIISVYTNSDATLNPITKKHGEYLDELVVTKEGHNFSGWFLDEKLTIPVDFTVPVSSSLNIYAKWQIKSYLVTFNSMGGNGVDSQELTYGLKVNEPDMPTKEGHTFAGWYQDKECTLAYNFNDVVASNVSLYAKWNVNSYIVTFISEEQVYKQENVNYGSSVKTPATPFKDGYTFAGWYIDKGFVNAYDFSSLVESNITLYANWMDDGIYIYFDATGGNSVDKIMIPHGEKLGDKLPTANKAGHSFEGWYLEETLQTRVYEDTIFNSSTTIYAKWQKKTYTITYDVKGAQEGFNIDTAVYGSIIDLNVKKPIKQHYIFLGWFIDNECEAPASTQYVVMDNVTLYAGWKAVEYTIKFDVDGGSPISEIKAEYNTVVSLNKYRTEREYSIFNGWYLDSDKTNKVTEFTVLGDTTVYADWVIKTFTVYFETNGGSAIASKTLTAGEVLNLNEISTTKANYIFLGWYAENTYATKLTQITITDNVTVYAAWEINTFTITFNSNGGTSFSPITQNYGTAIDLTTYKPLKDNYEFTGWYEDVNCTILAPSSYVIKMNTTLHAGWISLVYNVSFNKQNGTGGSDTVTLRYGQGLPTINVPTRDGYFFDGYFTQANGKGEKLYNEDGTPTVASLGIKNISTLYAGWTEGVKVTITVEGNGGSVALNSGVQISSSYTMLVRKGSNVNIWINVNLLPYSCTEQVITGGMLGNSTLTMITEWWGEYLGCSVTQGQYDYNYESGGYYTCESISGNVDIIFRLSERSNVKTY